jgi:hypothetical protein
MADQTISGTLSVTGNVGIGTEPLSDSQLYIRSTTNQSRVLVENLAGLSFKLSMDSSEIAIGTETGTTLPLNFHTNGQSRLSINSAGAINAFGSLTAQSDLLVNGNVGIGTSTPEQKLEVVGTVKATEFEGSGIPLAGIVKLAGDTMTGPLTIDAALTVSGNVQIGTPSASTVRLTVGGTVSANAFEGSGAALTDVQVPDGSISTSRLANGAVTNLKIADQSINTAKLANQSVTLDKLASTARPTTTTLNGISGNVNLIGANSITLATNSTTRQITVRENHSGLRNNPHGVTAGQVGALRLEGGTLKGRLWLTHNLADNEKHGFDIRLGSSKPCYGLVTRVGRTTSSSPPLNFAALAGASDINGVYGVYAHARNGTHALFVRGTAQFSGAKTGYVVDKFMNASGKRLVMGDVVKLKGNSIHHFYGDDNKIPVPEVVLADFDNDNCVIGIVDRESIPDQDETDIRVHPEDPTFVEDGGELFVVTLGTYAHCKVDATHTPIAVGDLLTSSTNPGHAQKATDPATGSIIGKALESLQEGIGHIAVFVNIQ